jgi:ketosteroid isomerase-like protein
MQRWCLAREATADLEPGYSLLMSQENLEVLRSLGEAWNSDDLDGFLAQFHPEVEFHSEIASRVEGAETFVRGHAGMRRFWEDWHAVWDLTIDVSNFHDLGDIVVSVGHIRVHGKRSGVEFESPVAYVNEFEGGLIRRVRAYLDPGQARLHGRLPFSLHKVGTPRRGWHGLSRQHSQIANYLWDGVLDSGESNA